MIDIKLAATSAAMFLALSFVLCVALGLATPEGFHMRALLEAALPGFRWISPGAFLLGLVESLLWGVYLGGGFSWIHNLLFRRWRGAQNA